MRGRSGAAGGVASTSPWPIVVAGGLAASELGVFVGSVPVAVGGLLLLGGGASGLVQEAGVVASPAPPLLLFGGVFVLVGAGIWVYGASASTVPALVAAAGGDGLPRRGVAMVVAGGSLVGVAIVGGTTWFTERGR